MKIIKEDKVAPEIEHALKQLVKLDINFYVTGGLLCQYYLKDHARYTKDIDIILNDKKEIIEDKLKNIYGLIDFSYNDQSLTFYENYFACFTKVNNINAQIEGRIVEHIQDIKYETYSYKGITFKGVCLEYVIADKLVAILNELSRPYKHLVDIYSFSRIDQSLINVNEIKRYMELINKQENIYRKEHGLKEYNLPKQIPENKDFKPPFILPTLQSKYNLTKQEIIDSVNRWLKNLIKL